MVKIDEFISAIVDGFIDQILLSYLSTRFKILMSADFLRCGLYGGQR